MADEKKVQSAKSNRFLVSHDDHDDYYTWKTINPDQVLVKPKDRRGKEKKEISLPQLSFEDISLIYEDPQMYKWIADGAKKRPRSEYDIMSKLVTSLLISKDNPSEEFIIVEDIPESDALVRYMTACSDNINKKMAGSEDIDEDQIYECQALAYKSSNIKSMSLEEVVEEASKYEEFFNYLNNKDTKTLITKETLSKALEVVNTINNSFLEGPGKNNNYIETGIVSEDLKIKLGTANTTATNLHFNIRFFPSVFYYSAPALDSTCGIIKYTKKPISRFKEDFEEFKYGLEIAHVMRCMESCSEFADKTKFEIYLIAFDEHGRSDNFLIKKSTLRDYVKQYDEMLKSVDYHLKMGTWSKPPYMTDEFKKL